MNYYNNICSYQDINTILKNKDATQNRFGDFFSIMKIGIKNLSKINMQYGYDIGEKIIQELGILLVELSRLVDVVGKWESGEYIVILPQTDKEKALLIKTSLDEMFEDYFRLHKYKIKIKTEIFHFNIKNSKKILNFIAPKRGPNIS